MGRRAAFGNLSASRGWRASAELHDDRLMASGFDEAEEIARREPRRGRVLERMAIDLGKVHQRLIDYYNGARRGIVHQGEGRHRAGRHAEHGLSSSDLPKLRRPS